MKCRLQSPANHPTKLGRAAFALAALGCSFSAHASAAQSADEGSGIVVLRDVPTRHAFNPGSGEALVVNTSPDQQAFGTIGSHLRVLDDGEAASVIGESILGAKIEDHVVSATGASISDPMSALSLETAAGAGGFSGTINEAIGTGMGALQGALSSARSNSGGPQ